MCQRRCCTKNEIRTALSYTSLAASMSPLIPPELAPASVQINLRFDATKAPVGTPSLWGNMPLSMHRMDVASKEAAAIGEESIVEDIALEPPPPTPLLDSKN